MGFLNYNQIENEFLDDRNKDLWIYLSDKYEIGVNDDYSFYKLEYLNDINPVYILTDKFYKKSLFTHELLHLELRSLQFDASKTLPESYMLMNNEIERLRSQISYNLANNTEHIIFLNRYLQLGFPIQDFVADYYTSNYPQSFFDQFNFLQSNPQFENLYNILFLSSYVTMYSESKYNLDRKNEFGKLLELNSDLYYKSENIGYLIENLNPYENKEAQIQLNMAFQMFLD